MANIFIKIGAYIELLKEIILDENFTINKFFRKIDLPFIQKKQAKNILYNALKSIKSKNNKQSIKARKLLEQEICHIRFNVLNEHIIESDKIIAGKRKSTDGYPSSKRIILTFANARINQDYSPPSILPSDFNHDHTNCEEDIETEYYDARKYHKICYSWEDIIEKINFRDSSKKDVKVNLYLCYKTDVQKIFLLLSSINMSNEDIFVHDTLHDLIKEIFCNLMLELVWANGGSSSSKSHCSSNKKNARDKKPDFILLMNTKDEVLFGELANFQAGMLDELIMEYSNRIGMATMEYGFVVGTTIHIYNMDLEYDKIYKMFLISEINMMLPMDNHSSVHSSTKKIHFLGRSRKKIVNHLIDNAKVVQQAWRAFKLRPETWVK
ncbi:hypothetical protein C1645_735412 [Glomus cerebriforme]|uniref:Uncharacterized protein n=1 Tax=Glomus cerebriforme TaxID=658196 RepID=A0A397T5V2_9GLOM|nr:hypothetical protein C1645_735412 [Glomus cerebriforme]